MLAKGWAMTSERKTKIDCKVYNIKDGKIVQPWDEKTHGIAFSPRQLILTTLPHRDPGNVPSYQRKNGNLTMTIQAGIDPKTGEVVGYPYGSIPRLLTYYLTTKAILNKADISNKNPRRIELGNTLAEFMRELGYNPKSGGNKSAARYLKEQIHRYFAASYTFSEERQLSPFSKGNGVEVRADMKVARKQAFHWQGDPDQRDIFGYFVELSEDFYEMATKDMIPAKIEVLRAIKKSPLALDLYAWLTREAALIVKGKAPRFVSWNDLMEQMGTTYSNPKNFARYVKIELNKIQAVYSGMKLGNLDGGILLTANMMPDVPLLLSNANKLKS